MTAVPTRTLRAHRETLAANPHAFTADMPRLGHTVMGHLKGLGYKRATHTRCGALAANFVEAILGAQDHKPFFYIDSPLPFCWNAPKDWDKDFIRYEWGHLRSRNQNTDANQIENLCLQSARCNQHVQTSMDIDEVAAWLEGSAVAARIKRVLEQRRELFASGKWRRLLAELDRYR